MYFICFLLTGLAIAIFLQKWMDLRHLLVEVKQSRSIVGFRQSQSIVECLLNAKMGRDMWMETELHWLENHCTDSLVFSNVYCATQDYSRSQIFHLKYLWKKALPPFLPSKKVCWDILFQDQRISKVLCADLGCSFLYLAHVGHIGQNAICKF